MLMVPSKPNVVSAEWSDLSKISKSFNEAADSPVVSCQFSLKGKCSQGILLWRRESVVCVIFIKVWMKPICSVNVRYLRLPALWVQSPVAANMILIPTKCSFSYLTTRNLRHFQAAFDVVWCCVQTVFTCSRSVPLILSQNQWSCPKLQMFFQGFSTCWGRFLVGGPPFQMNDKKNLLLWIQI